MYTCRTLRSRSIWLLCLSVATVLGYCLIFHWIKWKQPEIINTNDGPILAYKAAFFPLRYLHASKPDYYDASFAGLRPIDAKIIWLNPGGGYLYFLWQGVEYRAACFLPEDHIPRPGTRVYLTIQYQLETWPIPTGDLGRFQR